MRRRWVSRPRRWRRSDGRVCCANTLGQGLRLPWAPPVLALDPSTGRLAAVADRTAPHPPAGRGRMILVFAIGTACLALALPAPGDGPVLARPMVKKRLWQVGVALCALAIVAGDFHAGGVSALLLVVTVLGTATGLLFWLDGGRFDAHHTRRSLGWYFVRSGPGGWPMGGHRMMALITAALLLGMLALRPVARDLLGLDTTGIEAVMIMMGVA